MKERRRHLAEQRDAALGQRVPERQTAAPELFGDEELHRVVETAGIPVVELDGRIESGGEEGEKERKAKQDGRQAEESFAGNHDSRRR